MVKLEYFFVHLLCLMLLNCSAAKSIIGFIFDRFKGRNTETDYRSERLVLIADLDDLKTSVDLYRDQVDLHRRMLLSQKMLIRKLSLENHLLKARFESSSNELKLRYSNELDSKLEEISDEHYRNVTLMKQSMNNSFEEQKNKLRKQHKEELKKLRLQLLAENESNTEDLEEIIRDLKSKLKIETKFKSELDAELFLMKKKFAELKSVIKIK